MILVTSAKESTTPNMEHKKATNRKNGSFAFRVHEHSTS